MDFRKPPQTTTQDGKERRVGFELEFAGLKLPQIVDIVVGQFGGRPRAHGRFEQVVEGAEFGDYLVLMDSRVLHSDRYLDFLKYIGIDAKTPETLHDTEDFLENLAGTLVPCELVTPPVPLSQAGRVEKLRETLRRAGARGTADSPLYAFGLHLNVEAASLDSGWLTRMLQAYVLLEDWLTEESQVVFTRKLSSFIDPFPEKYAARILAEGYAPDRRGLIADYLEHNPTRNRSLDMLPLFCLLDCDLVHSHPVEHHKMKPRPAFHYRLPNCKLDEVDWRLAEEWNGWVEVERLAEDTDRLHAMARDFRQRPGFPGRLFSESWVDRVRRWME